MEIEKEINQIKKDLNSHERRITALEGSPRLETEKKKVSIKEFILSKKTKNDVQKTLAIGYYFEKYEGMPYFNEKDLRGGFRSAKKTVPKNVGDKIQKNVGKGDLMEAEEKKDNRKAWTLTNFGEKKVENNFKEEQ